MKSMGPAENEAKWSQLMAKSLDGDAAAYNLLLGDLVPYIRNFCRSKVRHLDLSDDVVQDALIALHRFRHTYDPSRPFLPWLRTIIRHKVIDSLRSHHRHMQNEIFDNETVDAAAQPDVNGLTSRQDAQDLRTLLKSLPEDYRQPIELLKIEEYSVEEVAGRLGLSPSAVKMRVHRGFKMLKERAEKEVYEE
ncbi:MAG TPA: sigma-70 family RNA polymerase sigma factor [Bdellovibrionales bacterium]|nr:sigma-70 family RNA polymerase sigma factor [Bdellovibrionales bacterium]